MVYKSVDHGKLWSIYYKNAERIITVKYTTYAVAKRKPDFSRILTPDLCNTGAKSFETFSTERINEKTW